MGLKFVHDVHELVDAGLKSDQNGIEIEDLSVLLRSTTPLKSDQNGIEINHQPHIH